MLESRSLSDSSAASKPKSSPAWDRRQHDQETRRGRRSAGNRCTRDHARLRDIAVRPGPGSRAAARDRSRRDCASSCVGFKRLQLHRRHVLRRRLVLRHDQAGLQRADLRTGNGDIARKRGSDAGDFLADFAVKIGKLCFHRDALGIAFAVAHRKIGLLAHQIGLLAAQLDDQRAKQRPARCWRDRPTSRSA